MPYKKRSDRLLYAVKYHAQHRPSPTQRKQIDESLPPLGIVVFSADGEKVQCHYCGEWYGNLTTHVKTHGMTIADYKEAYQLGRKMSLFPPVLQEKNRQAAIKRGLGDIGRDQIKKMGPGKRKPGIKNRLSSKIAFSQAKKGTYMGKPMTGQYRSKYNHHLIDRMFHSGATIAQVAEKLSMDMPVARQYYYAWKRNGSSASPHKTRKKTEIINLLVAGLRDSVIARQLACSRELVRQVRSKNKRKNKISAILARLADGLSVSEVAAQIGCTAHWVRRIRKKYTKTSTE